ncbi:MAG: hypothetical protein CMO55_25855 [Verrucomicrobiales bacterium]|nr:hypothetical protein [Verrucomicrobiales bacterium]
MKSSFSSFLIVVVLFFSLEGVYGQKRPKEPSWKMPPVEGPNLSYKTFESESAGEEVSYLLFLPPGYEQAKEERFPVVYWLHGIGGSQRGVPQICSNITKAIKAKKMPATIFVFANGMVDSFYCDSLNEDRPVESMIVKDLIPHVDETYRTVATREGRMIEGFSMGGFGAGHLGFKYPELFGSVSIIDGALIDLGMMKRRHSHLFKKIFDEKDGVFEAEHPLFLLEKNGADIKGRTVIRQAVGKIQEPNQALHDAMTEKGIDHEYESFPEAGHAVNVIYDKLGDKNWAFYERAFAGVK